MSPHYKDCDRCSSRSPDKGCTTCSGQGIVPLRPPVSEWVTYRRPLGKVEVEYMEKDPVAYPPIPKLFPMLVMHADRVTSGNRTFVRVRGYVVKGPTEARIIPLPTGQKIEYGPQPQIEFKRDVEGPSPEPGCWNWKERPS